MTVTISPDSFSIDAYLVCGTPRTGSTLLCGLLRSTEVAGRPESYFRQPDEHAWADQWRLARTVAGAFDYGDYVRAAMVEGSSPNGIFGARVMWGTLEEIVTKLGTVHPDLAGAEFGTTRRGWRPVASPSGIWRISSSQPYRPRQDAPCAWRGAHLP